MIALDIRRGQLLRLIETLGDVLAILRRDNECRWTPQFEQFHSKAEQLVADGFTQDNLVEFSRSVCQAYDPHEGGFSQYRPPAGLPGAENFETFTRVAYERALELRVVDK
jgi:hypothetical protein